MKTAADRHSGWIYVIYHKIESSGDISSQSLIIKQIQRFLFDLSGAHTTP